jgi:DNA-directed RNA polymerase subunit alpha
MSAVKYKNFNLPEKISVQNEDKENFFCRIVAEPFERGFGHTIGNTLRRVLLNSIEAPAIVSVMIEGLNHEYMGVEGIVEDMTHIVLNFKTALLRKIVMQEDKQADNVTITTQIDITQDMIDKANGEFEVTIGHIVKGDQYEVVNPDHVIFRATKPSSRKIVIKVNNDRGYVPSENQVVANKVVDEIVIDAIYSPVISVAYTVENCRVGGDTDMDRLILDITTDGRVLPKEAMNFAVQITKLHFNIFDELEYKSVIFSDGSEGELEEKDLLLNKLKLKINEIELSVRSTNCLVQANIDTIAELVIMPEPEMLKFRNFGKKSLNEIKGKLDDMKLYLGMDLSKYNITRENVKELIKEL